MRWVKIPKDRLPRKVKVLDEEEADAIRCEAGFFTAPHVIVRGPKGAVYALITDLGGDPLTNPRYVYHLLRR